MRDSEQLQDGGRDVFCRHWPLDAKPLRKMLGPVEDQRDMNEWIIECGSVSQQSVLSKPLTMICGDNKSSVIHQTASAKLIHQLLQTVINIGDGAIVFVNLPLKLFWKLRCGKHASTRNPLF